MNFLIIGAGFSGAVLARQLVESLDCQVEVWDERPHIGGNCHTERDPATGVMVHVYGPHIFNTDNEQVWDYVQKFGEFRTFVNRVKACTPKGMFSLPVNLLTINQLFGKSMGPAEAREFIASQGDSSIQEPANFEEQALKMLGRELYDTFFKGYSIKQWGCAPKELPASVLKRLPVRFNYDDNYYSKKYQGIPTEGYTEIIRNLLDHSGISLQLSKKFSPATLPTLGSEFSHVFYTGPIDAFYGYSEGRLGYRTVHFERIDTAEEDFQGNPVVNYTDQAVPWTRIHEHKHFTPWEQHAKTAVFKEFSKETEEMDVPYYPKRLANDMTILRRYRDLAEEGMHMGAAHGSSLPVSFLGRLATYRYMDMEAVIDEALRFSDSFIQAHQNSTKLPLFPNSIL